MGALTIASVSTFTSCKDYDDDISNLQQQIDSNAKAIETIQNLIKGGGLVTGVTETSDGITVKLSDGKSVTISNGKDGAPGTAWTIGADGYWYENGKKTDNLARGPQGEKGEKGDQLMRAAQVRADEMAATGTYSHTRPDGRKYYTVTDCRQVGENIHQIPLLYLAQQKTALAETLVYSWSKSAGHMENMTDESYAAIGVGLARGTDANGLECWYCVQLFLRSGYSISAVDKPATK